VKRLEGGVALIFGTARSQGRATTLLPQALGSAQARGTHMASKGGDRADPPTDHRGATYGVRPCASAPESTHEQRKEPCT
jgi:hypothetical protein